MQSTSNYVAFRSFNSSSESFWDVKVVPLGVAKGPVWLAADSAAAAWIALRLVISELRDGES